MQQLRQLWRRDIQQPRLLFVQRLAVMQQELSRLHAPAPVFAPIFFQLQLERLELQRAERRCACPGAAGCTLLLLRSCRRSLGRPQVRAHPVAPSRARPRLCTPASYSITGKADVGFRTAHACCRKGPFAPKGEAGASIYVASDSKQTMNAGNQ